MQIKKDSNLRLKHFSLTWALKALHQSNCFGSLLGPLQQCCSWHLLIASTGPLSTCVPLGASMENRNEGNPLRQAELMNKYGDLITKSAKWMELERERELERIAKAARDAAAAEQNLVDSDENERARKKRSAITQQLLFKKRGRRASRCAMNSMKKAIEVADVTSLTAETSKLAGSSSRTVFEDVTGLQLVEETEDDVKEFLKSIM